MPNVINDYLNEQLQIIAQVPRDPVNDILALLEQARMERRHIFLFGNGGSASTASHFACDLGKGTIRADKPRFKVMALHDNLPTFSAYANDMSYDRVFAEPLITHAEPGDIAIAYSGSGNSPNILRGLEEARRLKLVTVGFAGFKGGAMRELSDLCVVVSSDSMGQIEDIHLMLSHALCEALKIVHE